MKGHVLDYSVQTNSGIISGDDGQRYTFTGAEWKGSGLPVHGAYVDFESSGGPGEAVAIYLAQGVVGASAPSSSSPNKIVAGLLAILLGELGIHKFYLGYKNEGIALLAVTVIGVLLAFVLIGFFVLLAVVIVVFIEGVIYLVKTDQEFESTYVTGRRPWF